MNDSSLVKRVGELLRQYAFAFRDEVQLHEGIAEVLTRAGISHEREVRQDGDRFDFVLADGDRRMVIEAKVKGAFGPAIRQCDRYIARPDVSAVLLVSTRHWKGTGDSYVLHDKPVVHIRLGRTAL